MITAEQIVRKWSLDDGDILKEGAEAAAREYARIKVKEVVRAMTKAQLGEHINDDLAYLEEFVNYVLDKDYPLDENIV